MSDNYHTDIRLQLLANGYAILPNVDKACKLPGWNARDYVKQHLTDSKKGTAAHHVERWPVRFPDFHATGVRIEKALGAIDIDIDDEIVSKLWSELQVIAPEAAHSAPVRYGGGTHKVALFVRIEGELFGRIYSHKFFPPGVDPKADNAESHMVEIFGGAPKPDGNCSRQFGIYGPHSHNDDGTVKREYAWADGPTLRDTRLDELPALTNTQAFAIVDAFERLASAAGWTRDERAKQAESASAVYDIGEDTRFDTNRGGSGLTYAELCDDHAIHGDHRCAATFMPGRGRHDNRERAWVFHSPKHDCVAVYVYGDEQTHYPASCAPNMEKLADLLRKVKEHPAPLSNTPEPPTPGDDTSLMDKVNWLLATRGYFEGEDKVVLLYETRLDCRVAPGAFERRFKAWADFPADKRRKPLFATTAWELAPHRVNLAGVRMRPDQPFPLYSEGDRRYKNTYRRPLHAIEGGDVAVFLMFMQGFLPDPTDREWLLDWMAHKQARPEIPGTAVMFVADTADGVREGEFGTGRGLLFRIAHALYGDDYARSQTFSILDGSNSQSQFTDWMHGTVLVTVDESRTSPTSHRRGERHAAYEVLKDIVDPAPKRRSFTVKNGRMFDAMSYCSFWVATNHADALAIPANDRRFTVLRNGARLTQDGIAAIVAWIEGRANIAALSRFLAARDLSAFNMYQPLVTAAKAEMAELALSPVEDLLREMMADPRRGLAFTREHLRRHVGDNFRDQSYWHGEFEAAWSRYCVGVKHETTGTYRRVRMEGTQRKVFCFRGNRAAVEKMPEAALRREAAKWGAIEGVAGLVVSVGLTEKEE